MTSEPYRARRVFVWTWLPDESAPVVAGAVDRVGADRLDFTYARSYLENEKAVSLYAPELPLKSGSNRLGAIDFQESPEEYHPRVDTASLDEQYDAAGKVLAGEPLNPAIGDALMNGTGRRSHTGCVWGRDEASREADAGHPTGTAPETATQHGRTRAPERRTAGRGADRTREVPHVKCAERLPPD